MEHHYKKDDVTVINNEACIVLNSFEFKKRISAEEDILNIIYIKQEHPPPKDFIACFRTKKYPKSRLVLYPGFLKTFQV